MSFSYCAIFTKRIPRAPPSAQKGVPRVFFSGEKKNRHLFGLVLQCMGLLTKCHHVRVQRQVPTERVCLIKALGAAKGDASCLKSCLLASRHPLAQIDMKDTYGWTPLMHAVHNRSLLLERGSWTLCILSSIPSLHLPSRLSSNTIVTSEPLVCVIPLKPIGLR